MNTNQIINMIMRTVMRRLINSGVNAGFDAASKIGRPKPPKRQASAKPQAEAEPTPEQIERERIRAIRQARRAARQKNQS